MARTYHWTKDRPPMDAEAQSGEQGDPDDIAWQVGYDAAKAEYESALETAKAALRRIADHCDPTHPDWTKDHYGIAKIAADALSDLDRLAQSSEGESNAH